MATTVEVLYMNGSSASLAHIGDSRIYMHLDGKLKQLTKDHSLVQKLIDEGQITSEEANNHPNKNILTMALGDDSFSVPDLMIIPLGKGSKELFLVCSDGVTGEVSNSELEEILSNNDLKKIAEDLSFLIEQRGAPDNFSFVLARNF
jgi:protein phosphatase